MSYKWGKKEKYAICLFFLGEKGIRLGFPRKKCSLGGLLGVFDAKKLGRGAKSGVKKEIICNQVPSDGGKHENCRIIEVCKSVVMSHLAN